MCILVIDLEKIFLPFLLQANWDGLGIDTASDSKRWDFAEIHYQMNHRKKQEYVYHW